VHVSLPYRLADLLTSLVTLFRKAEGKLSAMNKIIENSGFILFQ